MLYAEKLAQLQAHARRNHNGEVSNYYYHTWIDYHLVWMSRESSALHFGYQDGTPLGHHKSLSYANEVLANTVGIRPGEQVLDAGCGLGGSSFWLATNRGAATVGITLGLEQASWAKRESLRRGLSGKCTFLVADFQRLPFPANQFDVVWAQESLCHSCAKSLFFGESYRVLRPGGRLVLADFFLRNRAISAPHQAVLKEWLDGWKIPHLWTAAQHSNAAKDAGFEGVSVSDVTRCTRHSHRRLYNLAMLALPVAVILQRAGLRNAVQHGNVLASIQQYQALRNNCWFYAILSARKAS